MIDLHCHVLPAIDDGPEIIEESVVMARAAQAAGTTILVATPHVSRSYPNDVETIAQRVQQLRALIETEGLDVELRAGAEVALTRAIHMEAAELEQYSLGGGPWLLVEPPFNPGARELDVHFSRLQQRGHRILLAHPERCPAFQRDPATLRALVDSGCLASLTAGSLVGRFGETVRRFSLRLLREGLAHNVASDAHDLYARPPGARAELEQSGAGELADWLVCEVPAAILDGTAIPPRPDVVLADRERPPRRWRWARGRPVRAS